jgi:predicted transcriptional regulator
MMAPSHTTSLRLSDELREQYETLAQITGRSRTRLMIEAMEHYIEGQMQEIALIQEGSVQLDVGQGMAHDEVVAQLISRGMLSAERLERDRAQRSSA